MAAYRKNARSGFANVAAQERQIAKHLDRENTGTVLREAHAIENDNRLRIAIDPCCRFYGRTTQARARLDVRPLKVVHARHEGVEAARVLFDEIDIDDALIARGLGLIVHGEKCLRHADEHGEITAWIKLVILGTDLRLRQRQHLNWRLRVGEALEATLA